MEVTIDLLDLFDLMLFALIIFCLIVIIMAIIVAIKYKRIASGKLVYASGLGGGYS